MSETARLTIEYVEIGLLDPNPWNPNVQDDRTAEAERESIEEHGFIDPVTVRPHPELPGRWQIIDGEHRVREASALGHTEAPIVVLPVDDDTAKRLTVILNETRGDHDIAKLGQLLAELSLTMDPEQINLGLPFTSGEMTRLIEIGRFEGWDDIDGREMGTRQKEDAAVVPSFTIEFATKRDSTQFSKLVVTLCREWELDEAAALTRAVKQAVQAR